MSAGPVPPIDDARLARQMSGAMRRTTEIKKRRKAMRAALVAAAAAALGCVLFFAWPRPAPVVSMQGTVLETHGAQTVTLADGTRIEIGPDTHLDFRVVKSSAIELVLERGEIELDVSHVEGRTFVVRYGERSVTVVGTRFKVTADGPRFSVSVTRGRVRVEGPEGKTTLGPGETFSSGFETTSTAPTATSASPEPSVSVPATIEPAPSARVETASAIFSRGQAALLAGKPSDAARAFDDVRRHHRADGHAGLAAFELGRLRLDELGDPSGAVEAFRDAIALSPGASYREAAEARSVEALDALHDTSAEGLSRCAEARDAYLSRYPGGVFRAMVSRRCAAR